MKQITKKNVAIILFLIFISILFLRAVYETNNIFFTNELYEEMTLYGTGNYNEQTGYSSSINKKSAYGGRSVGYTFHDSEGLESISLVIPLTDLEPSTSYDYNFNFDFTNSSNNLSTLNIFTINYQPEELLEDGRATTNINLFDEFGNSIFKQIKLVEGTKSYQVNGTLTSNLDGSAWLIINIPLDNVSELSFDISNVYIKYSEVK